jgi:hypothetical protein
MYKWGYGIVTAVLLGTNIISRLHIGHYDVTNKKTKIKSTQV